MVKLFKILLFLTGAVAAGALAADFFASPESVQREARLQQTVKPELPDRKPEAPKRIAPKPELPKPPAPPAVTTAPQIKPAEEQQREIFDQPEKQKALESFIEKNVVTAPEPETPQQTVKTQESLTPSTPGTQATQPEVTGSETEITKSETPSASTGGFVTDDTQTGPPQPPAQTNAQPGAIPQAEGSPIASLTEQGEPPQTPEPPAGETGTAAHGVPLLNPNRSASLEDKIGQMLIFGFQGTSPDQKFPQAVARQLATGTLGGVIFLRYNLPDAKSADRLMRYFHSQTANARHVPLFVLDQEGGRVQRLGGNVGVKRWPSPAAIGNGSLKQARAEYGEMAEVVRRWRFNVNLGPVVDVNINRENPIIGKLGRSYSGDPKRVTAFSKIFVEEHRKRNVLTALKHFPGHGSSEKDSHLGFTDISRTWKKDEELAPYKSLIKSGHVDMVMMGHLFLDAFHNGDAKKYPATLSRTVIDSLLRHEMNYDGVIISDDMQMGAIRKHFKTYEAAIRAIKAGVDLLIVSNSAKPTISLPESYIANIAAAARKDPELLRSIEKSYQRIVKMKQKLARQPQVDINRSTRQDSPAITPPFPDRNPAPSPRRSAGPANIDRAALAGNIDRLFSSQPGQIHSSNP